MGDLPTELNLHQLRACRHLDRTASDHRLIHGTRDDGAVLSTVVNCGVIDHPVTHEPRVAFVSLGGASRLRHIRHGSPLTVAIRRGWNRVAVTGAAEEVVAE